MLNKDKQKVTWLSKYGWRYKALTIWLETHSAPPAEKSTISQLKSVSMAFGENVAKRLSEQYGIPGIYRDPSHESNKEISLSDLDRDLLDQFHRFKTDRQQIEIIGYVKGKADELVKSKSNPTTRQISQKKTGTDN